jgi:transcriptional regulator with XRE-family HTH domain
VDFATTSTSVARRHRTTYSSHSLVDLDMTPKRLSQKRLARKPNVAYSRLWQPAKMAKGKKIHLDKTRSPLQRMLVKRLSEVMAERGITDNELAKRCEALGLPVGQSSISRITGGRQDPTLLIVYSIASALDVSASQLLSDPIRAAEPVSTNVKQFPKIPSMFGHTEKSRKNISTPTHIKKRRV